MMKSAFIFLIFLCNCQVSWYHTRIIPNQTSERQISEHQPILEETGTACFISKYKFEESDPSYEYDETNQHQIDSQFIENIRTNLKLKNRNTKHIKQIYGIPNSWPYLKELESFRTNKTFERFKQIGNANLNPNDKNKLFKYAEIIDADTLLYTKEQTNLNHEIENCDTYYQLSYIKKERDDYNSLLFLITLGVIPTIHYENHYFIISKRKSLESVSQSIKYKFGFRKVISWLLLPTFNVFDEVESYNKDYRFLDHSKDQFLNSLENKYSQPLPIKRLNPVYGDVIGETYLSDSFLFTTLIPVDKRFAIIRDGKRNVSFFDPIHGLFKIQAINVNYKVNSDFNSDGIEKTLKTYITTNLIDKIKKNYPKSGIVYELYSPEYRDGTYTFVLEIVKPDKNNELFQKEYYVFSCFKSQSQIFILTRSLPNNSNPEDLPKLAETKIIDFYSKVNFQSRYIEPKAPEVDLTINDGTPKPKNKDDIDGDEEDDDDNEDEEEELAGGGGGGASTEIDLSGLFSALKERTYIPRGKMDIKPGRFKFNNARFNAPKVTRSKFHFKPGRSKNFSRPAKWRR
ncbi:hypothetical protein AB3N60_00845 [Leptospira sp. WS39.C2]